MAGGKVIYRRRFPRRRFGRPVGFLADGNYDLGLCVEISEGGMMIGTNRDAPVGKKIVMTFVVPGADHVVVQGEVRYIQKGQGGYAQYLGVSFSNLEFKQKRMIREYIAKKTEAEAKQDAIANASQRRPS